MSGTCCTTLFTPFVGWCQVVYPVVYSVGGVDNEVNGIWGVVYYVY